MIKTTKFISFCAATLKHIANQCRLLKPLTFFQSTFLQPGNASVTVSNLFRRSRISMDFNNMDRQSRNHSKAGNSKQIKITRSITYWESKNIS